MRATLDDILITDPPPDFTISGMAYLEHKNVPNKSRFIHLQNSSMGASVTGPSCKVEPPALLCRI